MPMKLLDADAFRTAAKDGAEAPEGALFKFATTEPEMVNEDTRTVRFVFSDATVDHSGDSIDPKGWQLDIFKRNPVALFSHMSWDPPIGRASGVGVQGDKLVGDIEFATADVYEFADTIYRLVKGKFLNAVSVGFMPKEWSFTSDKSRPMGIDFKKQTLLEISVCPVPCNPSALTEARNIGVDTRPLSEWAEKVLDNGDTVFMPRKELETLRLQAKGEAPRRYYIQSNADLLPEVADRVREAVKRWQEDPNDILFLPKGVKLRTVEETPAPTTEVGVLDVQIDEKEIAEIVAKAGRRLSAATMSKLQGAMDMASAHHDAMTKCIKDVMGSDEDDPDGDFDDEPPGPSEVPPGSVIQENLTPEEQRLRDAAALRERLSAHL